MNNFNIICAILSLASIIGTLVRGILKSTANIIITSILIFYLIHTLTLGDEYSPIVPTFFLLLYVVFLNIKPKFFDISKNKNGNEMLEEFFKNIQAQGAQSSKTLQIIAETYKKGYSSVCIGCNDIIKILKNRAIAWSEMYYCDRECELGYLVNSTIYTIANISKANNIKEGIDFIENELDLIVKSNSPEKDDIIKQSIPLAKEIIEIGPNYKCYS